MNENKPTPDWADARGQKWRAHLAGMEAMMAPVDAPLIDALHLKRSVRIAEIGCGGGGTALAILRRAPAGSIIHGFDLSPGLIELARIRQPAGVDALAFSVADMETAPAPPELYGRLVSRFGVMFFPDPLAAFTNLINWLAPGGRLAFAVWGPQADNVWFTATYEAVTEMVAMPESDLAGPGPFRYAEQSQFLALLDQAGFGELEVADWQGALPVGGGLHAGDAAQFALAAFSSFEERLAEAGAGAFDAACQSLTRRFSRHLQDGSVLMNARIHIVTGARPLSVRGSPRKTPP